VLSKVAGAPDELIASIGMIALGQHSATEMRDLADLATWLDAPHTTPPTAVLERSATTEHTAHYAALVRKSVRWFGHERSLPSDVTLTRVAAGYALLIRLGAVDAPQLHAFISWARLPVILGEALRTKSGSVMHYPTDLPPYRYFEDEAS
jgi:hypothetical protein